MFDVIITDLVERDCRELGAVCARVPEGVDDPVLGDRTVILICEETISLCDTPSLDPTSDWTTRAGARAPACVTRWTTRPATTSTSVTKSVGASLSSTRGAAATAVVAATDDDDDDDAPLTRHPAGPSSGRPVASVITTARFGLRYL
jgi:hypothetical protein